MAISHSPREYHMFPRSFHPPERATRVPGSVPGGGRDTAPWARAAAPEAAALLACSPARAASAGSSSPAMARRSSSSASPSPSPAPPKPSKPRDSPPASPHSPSPCAWGWPDCQLAEPSQSGSPAPTLARLAGATCTPAIASALSSATSSRACATSNSMPAMAAIAAIASARGCALGSCRRCLTAVRASNIPTKENLSYTRQLARSSIAMLALPTPPASAQGFSHWVPPVALLW
mmetsp:Transcript_4637/g.19767  ORF Transcript_4637/g.19767 Transcript_4637/m.19767 type:complete len:234 (-) Transcript_4637:162-863(-)